MRAPMIREDVPPAEPRRLAGTEDDPRVARQRPAIGAAPEGMSRKDAARSAGMDGRTLRFDACVERVIRCNCSGPAGLSGHWGDGRPCRLTEGRQARLTAIVLTGPDPEVDGVSTWRLIDLCRIVREGFGVDSDESGLGKLLHRRGLSRQTPRPRHAWTDRAGRSGSKKGIRRCPRADRSRPSRGRAYRGPVPGRGHGRTEWSARFDRACRGDHRAFKNNVCFSAA